MIPVTLNHLDSGLYTYDVTDARGPHLHIVARVASGHGGDTATGTTQEGQRFYLQEFQGQVTLWFPETNACFRFPATATRRRHITGLAYQQDCGNPNSVGFAATVRKGRRCR